MKLEISILDYPQWRVFATEDGFEAYKDGKMRFKASSLEKLMELING